MRSRRLALTFAAAALAAVIGVAFAGFARTLPITFDQPIETFAFGPLVGTLTQPFDAPGPYLSGVEIRLRARSPDARGVPVNLRLRSGAGRLLAEQRLLVESGPVARPYAFTFTPLSEAAGQRFRLEIQKGEGPGGRLFVPIFRGATPGAGPVIDHDGRLHPDWSTQFRLFQTVRPATYFRELLRTDTLTAAGVLAAAALVMIGAALGLDRAARRFGSGLPRASAWFLGLAVALGAVWAAYALLPTT